MTTRTRPDIPVKEWPRYIVRLETINDMLLEVLDAILFDVQGMTNKALRQRADVAIAQARREETL